MSDDELHVYLLGPPGVEGGDGTLTIPRRQVRALLYYLAIRPALVPREHLCFLFWPDIPEFKARRSLSSLLSHLQRALPVPEVLLTPQDRVGLDRQRVWSDTVTFESLRAASQNEAGYPRALQEAVDLYRGPFLAGFSLAGSPEFEMQVTLERQGWERHYLETLSKLTKLYAARGEVEAAIACARRYLATDELAEDMHRRLIQLLVDAGDRNAAMTQYERCAIVLERELGVGPLPETQAAYRAIRGGRPHASPPVPPGPAWTTLPSLEAPLVGRKDAFRQLKDAYAQARAGRGRIVLISGEPGIGKSRLMQDFGTGLARGTVLLAGSGHETEQGVPYSPLVQALEPHLETVDWTTLDVAPIYLAEVARLLPALRGLMPGLPEPYPAGPGHQQGGLFQALTRCLISLASGQRPLILCLDNLHWADTATLSYLGYLGRHLARVPMLVLGAYRSNEAAAVIPLRAELRRAQALQEIRLLALTPAEVLHLIQHMSGQSSSVESLSRRLHREAGGNPFFVLEILRAMFESGILREEEMGWRTTLDETGTAADNLPLPPTVTETIRDRLKRLSPQAHQVLEAGAVIGHRFDYDLLWYTSGRREAEVVDALEVLTVRQVIAEQDAEGVYRFRHDLIRGVVYGDLSYGRRRLLHRRAGEALEKQRPEDSVALAQHWERAERMDLAIDYLLEAGERAMRVAAPEEAVTHLKRGLTLLKTLPAGPERAQRELQLQLALGVSLQITQGHSATEAGRAHARARELSQQLDNREGLFAALGVLLMFHTTRGEQEAAQEIGEILLQVAQEAEEPTYLMPTYWHLGVQRLITGALHEAREHLERAMACYEPALYHGLTFRYGLEPGVLSLAALSWVLWTLGYPDQALEKGQKAIALARRLNYPPGLAMAQVYAGILEGLRGNWDAVQKLAEETLHISREHGLFYWKTGGLVNRGRALVQQGKLDEGIAQMRQGIAESRDMEAKVFGVLQMALLAESYLKAGRVEAGLVTVEKALEITRHTGERFFEPETWRLRGELLLAQKTARGSRVTAQAEACFERALEVAQEQEARSLALRAATSLCRLWQERGQREASDQVLSEIYGWFTEGFETQDLRDAQRLMETL